MEGDSLFKGIGQNKELKDSFRDVPRRRGNSCFGIEKG